MTERTGLLLDAGEPSARFWADREGGPGYIDYTLCYDIRVAPDSYERTMRINRVQYWAFGPDASVYTQGVYGSIEGNRLGGDTGSRGFSGCAFPSFRDRDLARPTATTVRLKLEYVFEGAPATDVRELTVERPITASVPQRPLMTGLTLTSDVPGQPPLLQRRRTMTFVATGSGGRPPYEYEWRANGTLMRSWSTDGTFLWDGTFPGVPFFPSGSAISVSARSAGGTDPEVIDTMTVIILSD